MKKLLPVLLCLSLGFFTVARATHPAHALAAGAKTSHKRTGEKPDVENSFNASADDDSVEGASDNEGEDINDDNDDGGNEHIADDDGGNDDEADEGDDDGDDGGD
jgi:hypothetical protein